VLSEERIGLAEAIRRVRAELEEARREAEGNDPLFRLAEVSLEYQSSLPVEDGDEVGGQLGFEENR
jgi:hypothetical protein